MGSDLTVCDAARVSFAKESKLMDDGSLSQPDCKLIAYLAKYNHFTPFCHCVASFRIKAPIFVARQLAKHQIGFSWNEESRRYIADTPEYWLPNAIRTRPDGSIKQGSGGEHGLSDTMLEDIAIHVEESIHFYNEMIENGAAPEQARMILPLNTMTEWIWTGSLAAWARMCKLRLDAHAQAETREVALLVAEDMSHAFPVSWAALIEVNEGG